jgi:autotransporter translocation and assembly factor TamB
VKRWLLTGLLLLTLSTATAFGWLLHSENGLRWIYRQAVSLAPGELEIQRLSGSLAGGVILQGIEYSDNTLSLHAGEIILRWDPVALLSARIDVSSLAVQQLDIELHPAPAAAHPEPASAGLPQLDLPLDLRLGEVLIDQLRLTRGEQLYKLEQVRLHTTIHDNLVNIDNFSLQVVDLVLDADHRENVSISLHGEIDTSGDYPHRLEVDWQARLSTGGVIDGSTRLSGNLKSTQLSHESSGALQAKLSLTLQNPLDNLQWQATLDLPGFDTSRLDATLPAARGNLQLSAEGNLDSAHATGRLEVEASEQGKFNARFDLRSLDQPRLMDGVHIESLELDADDGKLAIQGQLFWSPVLSWKVALQASDFNPAGLLPDWPGRLNAKLQSMGQIENGVLDVSARIAEASGRLRDYPFSSLQGNLHWRDDVLDVEVLELGIYEGKLAGKGQLSLSPLLRWEGELQASDINPAGLVSDWPGKLNARLQSTGRIENDVLDVSARIFEASGRLRDYSFASLQGNLHWRDDVLDVESLELGIYEGKLAGKGQLFLSPLLHWEGELQASDINPASLLPDWPGKLNAKLQSTGQIENGALDVTARIFDASGKLRDYPFSLQSNLRWRNDNLEVEFARLKSGNTMASAHGRAGETLDLEWSLDSQDLAELYPSAGGQLKASGHLGGKPGEPIVKARFKGQSLAFDNYSAASIDGEIAVDLLNWEQLDIRIAASQLDIEGQRLQSLEIDGNQRQLDASLVAAGIKAKLRLAGALVDSGWNGKLETANIDTDNFADWNLKAPVAISLGKDTVSIESMCLLSSQRASACGDLRRNQTSWQVQLELNRIPLPLLSPWISPDLDLDGVLDARANLELRADGRLLGKLDASLPAGSASYALAEERTERFDYRLGELHLLLEPQQATANTRMILQNGDQLEGSLVMPGADILKFDTGQQAIEARIEVKAQHLAVLEALLPQIEKLSGNLELSIDASGSFGQPRLRGSASLRAGSFTLHQSGQKIEQIDMNLHSDGSDHARFDITAMAAGGNFTIRGDTLLEHNSDWASDIVLSGEGFDIASLVNPWLEQPLQIDGRLKADARLQFRAPDQILGEITLDSTQGKLTYPLVDQEQERWNYSDASLSLILNEQGIVARSDANFGNDNGISARISLPGASLLAMDAERQALSGNVDISLERYDLLQYQIPDIDKIKGRLELALALAGTLAEPKFGVTADLQQGSFDFPRLGLQIRQLSLQGTTDDDNHFNFKISATSGEGSLSIEGSCILDAARGWPSTIHIRGENFEVSRIPEALVSFSPDLTITVEGRNIDITGDLLVPFAKLQPRDFSSAARVSSDTVIIGGEQQPEESWLVSTRVNVTLGERVTFFGFGFEGRLGGRLLVLDVPGQSSTGTGEIIIYEGRYRAYGQRLDIENGRLLFTGGTLDNPGLDLRAVRQVNDITVGLLVHGRLQKPELELFSIPAMEQTDMLSYLLLGRPMETTSGTEGEMMAKAALALGLSGGDSIARRLGDQFGLDEVRVESNDNGDQASLVVGRYLSPDLYVSYGVGLIDALNTLKLRYRLAERWHVQVESGVYQGADLLFTIER